MKLTKRVLHHTAKPVEFKWIYRNAKLANEMLAFMRKNGAIGLAATQIGETARVFVMDVEGTERCCFNPEITESSTELADFDEGCLSFPGESCIIKRPVSVQVRYQNIQGTVHEETLTGMAARCFQHELDHLNGITMWDRYKEQNAE